MLIACEYALSYDHFETFDVRTDRAMIMSYGTRLQQIGSNNIPWTTTSARKQCIEGRGMVMGTKMGFVCCVCVCVCVCCVCVCVAFQDIRKRQSSFFTLKGDQEVRSQSALWSGEACGEAGLERERSDILQQAQPSFVLPLLTLHNRTVAS